MIYVVSENQSVRYLKGVGEKRAAMYLKLGVETVGDLLRYFPRDYIDLSKVYSLSEAPRGEKCAIRAEVTAKSAEMRIRKGLSVFKVTATDGERDMVITYFNTKYTVQGLKIGEEYIFYGTVTGSFVTPEMSSPMVIKSENINKFIPIYGLTAGLTSKAIAANVRTAVDIMSGNIKDYLDEKIKDRYSLCGLEKAIINIHFPENREILKEAKSRIVFDEALQTCIGLAMMRKKNEGVTGVSMQKKDLEPFCKALPFKMTSAQIRAVREITDDMCKSVPMNRLLQGDVGSGKTAVCAAAAYFAYLNGKQTALMAPTELLARQHYDTLKKMLEFSGMRIELITGSIKAKEKRTAYERAENCESDLVVGTHALIEDKLRFGALGLVVTDEMHRFGVAQRAKLDNKDGNPHMLVMSATPIPRTLAYVSYGDLDISELNELPGGRIPVKTYLVDGSKRKRAYGFIKRFLDENRKGYIICPLVEDDEENESGLFNVEEYAENIKNEEFKGYGVGILHGKMKPSEKEEV
ncbi:MAG: ATP-dependent DNA helicase RecG, partial [Oscillospiraceae bacterium]|nr:ATP-dependent DNA helicase RecG [Oscillospiraceae bacterium]